MTVTPGALVKVSCFNELWAVPWLSGEYVGEKEHPPAVEKGEVVLVIAVLEYKRTSRLGGQTALVLSTRGYMGWVDQANELIGLSDEAR